MLQFVSIINDDYKTLKIEELRKKFDIEGDYFISPNQFWQHKNHSVIVKAVEILKERGTKVLIVFTGKEHDHRNPNYVNDLKNEIYRNNMQGCFRFLGFIDRGEQLQLMKNSISVIQPSLFEGWSTVVEDTKVLNHKIILSDLPLHREQINKNYLFFNPLDAVDLADKIEYAMSNNFFSSDFPNDEYRYVFAKKIIDLFEIE